MAWSQAIAAPALPTHCHPNSDFLARFSAAFHVCVPTPLAFASNLCGTLSIIAWLGAQLPQIYKNYSIQSTSGLSFTFLAVWCLGDISNLLGALFTHQATWQIAIGAYYVFVDVCLVIQWVWYERLRHGHPVLRIRWGQQHDPGSGGADGAFESSDMEHVVIEGLSVLGRVPSPQDGTPTTDQPKPATRPKVIFRAPTFRGDGKEKPDTSPTATPSNRNTIQRVGPSFQLPSPSPRTVLLIACLAAIVQASPLSSPTATVIPLKRTEITFSSAVESTPLEQAGTVLSWFSTFLYLSSRLPQLLKNWRRQSTAGLSAHLFIAAFLGNLFYSAALLTNPSAWSSFGPYGGGGWAGPDGSERTTWVLAALPFFLGAAGVLGLDGTMGLQFLMYGDAHQKLLVVDDESDLARLRTAARSSAPLSAPPALPDASHWRRVSGWMRGWIPSVSEQGGSHEHQALIVHARPDTGMVGGQTQGDAGYGTL